MEVMEEGILMDRLPILLQRDMQYYEVFLQLNEGYVMNKISIFIL